jgi:hypothetical protein
MNTNFGLVLSSLVLLAGAVALLPTRTRANPNETPDIDSPWREIRVDQKTGTPETVIRRWPEFSQKTARVLIAEYGSPDAYASNSLMWRRNGSWSRTVLFGRSQTYPRADRQPEILMQVVAYRVPASKTAELSRFDRRLRVDRQNGELSFQSARESTNFLALNLADEIIRGVRTVPQARRFLRDAEILRRSGKSSRYMDRLLFQVRRTSLDYPE